MPEYSEEILDSNSISSTDKAGRPIPVTIPIALAPGIKVVYTTRLGGLSAGDYGNLNLGGKSGDEPEAVLSNRIALAEAVQARLSLVSQVHSGVAVDVDDSFVINTPFGFDVSGTHGETDTPHVIEADGQVTAQSGIALGMFAADCLPVLLGDPVTGIIGAAHCGRRGLERGVIGATVDLMKSKGADPANIVATLGPRICGDCYEVGDEIADQFIKRFPLTKTKTRFGGAGIDIAEAAMIDLAFAGVHQVVDSMPRVHAATQYLDRNSPNCAVRTAKARPSSRSASTTSATACARSKTHCGTRTAAPRSPTKHTKAASSPSSCVTKRRMRAHSVEKM